MPHTSPERYAVVSCHVERPLDDRAWSRFSDLQDAAPGGFRVAALVRPPDVAHGEDVEVWTERALDAATRGPLGVHTHWTAPDHARPTGGDTAARVRADADRFGQAGLAPTLFCGGGWYTDEEVAETCASLGLADCSQRAARPPYLQPGERWASLAEPTPVELPSGRTLRSIPTTHSLGDLARALARPGLPGFVHVYFHDTDLLDARRRILLGVVLRLLARRARVADLDAVAATLDEPTGAVRWADVARL